MTTLFLLSKIFFWFMVIFIFFFELAVNTDTEKYNDFCDKINDALPAKISGKDDEYYPTTREFLMFLDLLKMTAPTLRPFFILGLLPIINIFFFLSLPLLGPRKFK